jgi:hypothetical protein
LPKGIPAKGYRNRKNGATNQISVARMSMPEMTVVFETDEQIREKLETRFAVIRMMTEAACEGSIRALIVSGAPGLGKSFTILNTIEEYDPEEKRTVICKGFTRSSGLYKTLYQYRHKKNVIILDDIDSAFSDPDSLNLLKAACDSTGKRRISWGAEIRIQGDDGAVLPNSFEFEGSIIIITNYNFQAAVDQGSKLAGHFEALMSRSHYVETAMRSQRDYIIRIKQVVEAGMLRDMGLAPEQEFELLEYIDENAGKLRELTLRCVSKLANLYISNQKNWKKIAAVTCMRSA